MKELTFTKSLLAAVAILAMVSPAVAVDPALQDGLFAYWNFDDGSGSEAVDSINGNNAALDPAPGAPTWATGKLSGALSFDGTDDVAYLPSGGALDPASNGMTISAWVNLGEYPSLISGGFGAIMDSNQDAYILYVDQGNAEIRCKFTATDAAGTAMGSARPGINEIYFETGQWLHVVGTFDGTDARIYLNGELRDTHTVTGPGGQIASGQEAGLGMQPGNPAADPPTDPSAPYNGKLDDLGLWNRPLSSAEISHLYNAGSGRAITAENPTLTPIPGAGDAPAPVLHYNFEGNLNNEGSGGAAYNGTLVGATGTMSYIAGATTESGQGMDLAQVAANPFDGVHVEVDYTLPNEGTMMFWAKPGDFYNYLALFDNNIEANDWEMWVYENGIARFRLDSGVVDQDLNALDGANQWYHFTMSWAKNEGDAGMGIADSSTLAMYVNGERIAGSNSNWVDPGTTFGIGGGLLNPAGNAAFDDFRIYEAVLTAEQILDVAGIPANIPGDANRDGVVNDEDAAVLANNWLGTGKTWAQGDFNEDGVVDDIDATILATNWQTTASASVPEPGSITLLLGMCLLCLPLLRRKVR